MRIAERIFAAAPISTRERIVIATLAALAAAAIVVFDTIRAPTLTLDIDQVQAAARFLANDENPYTAIGPGRAWDSRFWFYYPLTAPLLLYPAADWSPIVVRGGFIAISAWLLAFGMLREGWHRVPILLSGAWIAAVKLAQWTPLLTAVWALPVLGFVLAAKPNLGIALLVGMRSWRDAWIAACGCVVVGLVSLLLWPGWITEWRDTLSRADHFAPAIALPGGVLLLAALLRWRRWETRLLLAMSLIPLTPGIYSALPLLLIPRNPRMIIVLSALTHVVLLTVHPGRFPSFERFTEGIGTATLWALYLPILLVLLRMPNEGPAPAWLERAINRWPRWLRGTASPSSS